MKQTTTSLRRLLGLLLLATLAYPAQAQFPTSASQTFFVCNAPGNQHSVQAFADGAGGSYVLWIDRRGVAGGQGTGIYAQRLNAAGQPQWTANGRRLLQTQGREIFGLKAVPWQSGMLVAWVQGAYGVGGDTVRCQYYNAAGVAQWAMPTLLAARTLPTVIYEMENGLNVIPNDSGATITHGLALNGGSDRLTFNRVSFTGRRRWPNNHFQIALPFSSYYQTISDGTNGFYVVGGSGGLGTQLYAQHYSLTGTPWATGIDLTATGANGRGNSPWRLVRDANQNLYVVWGSNSGDIIAYKVTPTGTTGWTAPGYRTLCTNPARQGNPYPIWHNNALWVVWDDYRLPASLSYQYVQKVSAAGVRAWSGGGVLVNNLPDYYTYPKIAASDNGSAVALFTVGTGFRAQKIRPDSTIAWPLNGIPVHSVAVDQAFQLDYEPVSQPNGAVQVFWSSPGAAPTGADICAARVQSTGTLLSATERAAEAAGFLVYPNPATTRLQVNLPVGPAPTRLHLYDAQGRRVRSFNNLEGPDNQLSVASLPAGLYVLRATFANRELTRRVVLVGE